MPQYKVKLAFKKGIRWPTHYHYLLNNLLYLYFYRFQFLSHDLVPDRVSLPSGD